MTKVASVLTLGWVKVDVPLRYAPESHPPGPEDRPLRFSSLAMNIILHIAFAVLVCAIVISLLPDTYSLFALLPPVCLSPETTNLTTLYKPSPLISHRLLYQTGASLCKLLHKSGLDLTSF